MAPRRDTPVTPIDNPEGAGRWTFPIFLDYTRETPASRAGLWRDSAGNIIHGPDGIVHVTADVMSLSHHSSPRLATGISSPFPRPFAGKPKDGGHYRGRSLLSNLSSLNLHLRKGSLLSNLSGHMKNEGAVANIYRSIEKPVNPQIRAPFEIVQPEMTYYNEVTRPDATHSSYRSVARSSSVYSTPSPRLDYIPSPRIDIEHSSGSSMAVHAFHRPLRPVGFWDATLSHTRRRVFMGFAKTLLILLLVSTMIFSIHAGVFHEVDRRLSSLSVAVVNFGSESDLQTVIQNEVQSNPRHLGYEFLPSTDFQDDPDMIKQAVYEQRYWAAILLNATDIQLVYNSGRDYQTYNTHIIPVLNRLLMSPSVVVVTDLRPISTPSIFPTIGIDLVYLMLVSFLSYSFFIRLHMQFLLPDIDDPHAPLKFSHWVVYRWLASTTVYFSLAGTYSLVNLAFQIPFNSTAPFSAIESISNATTFGHATFPIYCTLNFVGIMAFGLICENATMFLSTFSATPYALLFAIFWLVLNATVGLNPVELANPFYEYGYIMPMRQMAAASKTLLLGTTSNLPVNFGILVAWVAFGTVLFPGACWIMRWKGIETRLSADKETKRMISSVRRLRDTVHF